MTTCVEIKFYGAFAIDAAPARRRAPDALVDFHTGNDALHDGVLTRDVHNLTRLLFHAFAGPAPIQRLAGGLRFEYSLELVDLGFVFS